MMADAPTTRDLFRVSKVGDADIKAAIDAYLADLAVGVMPMGTGYHLDITEAVEARNLGPLRPVTDPHASHLNRA